MPEEFYPYETYFFSLFLYIVPHHKKCLRSSLLNVIETGIKHPLRLALLNLSLRAHVDVELISKALKVDIPVSCS
jgi:hypothetical protein